MKRWKCATSIYTVGLIIRTSHNWYRGWGGEIIGDAASRITTHSSVQAHEAWAPCRRETKRLTFSVAHVNSVITTCKQQRTKMHTACVVHLWLTSCSWIKATSIISQRFEGECMLTHNSLKGGAFAVAASPNCYRVRAAIPQHSISSQRTPYNRVMQLSWRVLDEASTMHKSLQKGI